MFLNTADYVETISDLEKLRSYRAALVRAYSLAQGVAHIKSVDAAGIIDEISSVDYAIRELTDKLNAFDAKEEWYAGRAVKVA